MSLPETALLCSNWWRNLEKKRKEKKSRLAYAYIMWWRFKERISDEQWIHNQDISTWGEHTWLYVCFGLCFLFCFVLFVCVFFCFVFCLGGRRGNEENTHYLEKDPVAFIYTFCLCSQPILLHAHLWACLQAIKSTLRTTTPECKCRGTLQGLCLITNCISLWELTTSTCNWFPWICIFK